MRFALDAVITLVALAVIVGVAVYSRIHAGGLAADAEPGRPERAIAARLVRLSIPAAARREENPFRSDAAVWRTSADHFEDHCAVCHGVDGHGHTELGDNMYPKVPDLGSAAVQRLSDGDLFYIVQNGVRWTGMPAWRGEHTQEDTWRLVSFVRKVPSLTRQELESAGVELGGEHHHEHERHDHDHSMSGEREKR